MSTCLMEVATLPYLIELLCKFCTTSLLDLKKMYPTYDVWEQWRKMNIFQRGQIQFSQFFPSVKYDFFPVKIVYFGRSQTNFSGFKK